MLDQAAAVFVSGAWTRKRSSRRRVTVAACRSSSVIAVWLSSSTCRWTAAAHQEIGSISDGSLLFLTPPTRVLAGHIFILRPRIAQQRLWLIRLRSVVARPSLKRN
jgi:hypothetical protein